MPGKDIRRKRYGVAGPVLLHRPAHPPGGARADARHRFQRRRVCRKHRLHRAEALQQAGRPLRADAGQALQQVLLHRRLASGPAAAADQRAARHRPSLQRGELQGAHGLRRRATAQQRQPDEQGDRDEGTLHRFPAHAAAFDIPRRSLDNERGSQG